MNQSIISSRGVIVHGNHLGSTIGFPTINIFPEDDLSGLERGVYFSNVSFLSGKHKGQTYNGITNVGVKPTVQNSNRINLETYIYDFKDDVYEEAVSVSLLKFTRPEMKFDSVDALTARISEDINNGKSFFNKTIG